MKSFQAVSSMIASLIALLAIATHGASFLRPLGVFLGERTVHAAQMAPKSGIPAGLKSSDGSEIGITIMGTIVQRKAENNVVLVKETKSGKVRALKPGFTLLEKFTIVEISAKYMVIADKDQKSLVYQDKFAGDFVKSSSNSSPSTLPAGNFSGDAPEFFKEEGFERQANAINMTGSYRDKLVNQDMANILMQATAEPQVENGQVVGFKLSQIDAGSVYWKGGLKDDDVITDINGQKLDSVAKAVSLLKSMKQETSVEVNVLRKGAPVQIMLKIN